MSDTAGERGSASATGERAISSVCGEFGPISMAPTGLGAVTATKMKHFGAMQIEEAYAYAAAGGQALHTHEIIVDESRAPRCFVNAIRRGEKIAHLFDRDQYRLVRTARQLGVRVIFVDCKGTSRQHVDLCGVPLRKALLMCEENR